MNILPREKQIEAVAVLTEGVSVRAAERLTGVKRGNSSLRGSGSAEASSIGRRAALSAKEAPATKLGEWGANLFLLFRGWYDAAMVHTSLCRRGRQHNSAPLAPFLRQSRMA